MLGVRVPINTQDLYQKNLSFTSSAITTAVLVYCNFMDLSILQLLCECKTL